MIRSDLLISLILYIYRRFLILAVITGRRRVQESSPALR